MFSNFSHTIGSNDEYKTYACKVGRVGDGHARRSDWCVRTFNLIDHFLFNFFSYGLANVTITTQSNATTSSTAAAADGTKGENSW
jgi:hypothetical protein